MDTTQSYVFPTVDLYSRPIDLLVGHGTQKYSTLCGSMLSILTLIAIIGYSIYQIQLMMNHEDYFSKLEVYEDEFSFNEPFRASEIGFHIAAAITDYTDSNDVIEDPTYGEIVFLRKSWDNSQDITLNFAQLQHKQC